MRLTDIVDGLRRDGAVFRAQGPEDWTQGRTLFGGLQAALLVRAMRADVEPGLPLRTLQTTFVGPVMAGALTIRTRVLRVGKSATHAEAQIVDGDAVLCSALAVFGRARTSAVALSSTLPEDVRGVTESKQIPHVPGLSPAFTRFVEQRWAQGAFPFCGGQRPHTRIWLRYADEPRCDESTLIALADSVPSPALSVMNKPAPASSLSWTLELLTDAPGGAPEDYWLMDAQATHALDGYVFQTATLYHASGRAVALSRQSATVFG